MKVEVKLQEWPLPKKGIMKDVKPEMVPPDYWVKAENAAAEFGTISKLPGLVRIGTFALENPVQLIDQLPLSTGVTKPIFACATEIYSFDDSAMSISPITRYSEGTISVTNGSAIVTGTGTNFDKHIKANDTLIDVNGAARNYVVQSVDSATQVTLTANYTEASESGVSYKIRQVFTSTGTWSSEVYKEKLYFANGADVLMRWNGTDTWLEIVPDNPPIARYLRTFLEYLVLGFLKVGTTLLPWAVAWNDAGDPDNWSTGDSQQRTLPEGDDWILGLERLRDRLIIYRERSENYLELISGPFVFFSGQASAGLGPISSNTIINMIDEHIFLTPAGLHTFAGDAPELIGEGTIQQWLVDSIHPGKLDYITTLVIEEKNLIYIFYPSTSVAGNWCDRYLVYNYLEDSYSEGTIPNITATGFYSKFDAKVIDNDNRVIDSVTDLIDGRTLLDLSPINIVGDKDGKIYQIDGLNVQDGATKTAIDVSAETGVDNFGDPTKNKVLRQAYFDAEANSLTTINLYIGIKDTPFSGFVWKGPYSVPVGGQKEYVDLPRLKGKYFARRFEVKGVDTAFELRRMFLEYTVEGTR